MRVSMCFGQPIEAAGLCAGTPGGEEAVPQPSTPSREEVASPSAKKGHRLGTRENGTCREYEELYEEANNLLKNLHFEWLHRKSSQN